MAQSVDDFLRNQNLTANITVLALSQTGVGTIGSHGGVNDLGVTQSVDDFLCNQDLTAHGAVLAPSQAGVGTVRSHGGVNDLGVTQSVDDLAALGMAAAVGAGQNGSLTGSIAGRRDSGNGLLHIVALSGSQLSTTHSTGLGGGTGGLSASGVAQSVDDFLSNQNLTAHGAALALSQAGVSTIGSHGWDSFHFGMVAFHFVATYGTNTIFIGMIIISANPLTVSIGIGNISGCSGLIAAITIQKLGRGDGNFHKRNSSTTLRCLICYSICSSSTRDYNAAASTADVGAASCGINIAVACINRAIYRNLCVYHCGARLRSSKSCADKI